MQQVAREAPKDNDLFYTCSLIDYIARKTKNTRSDVVNKLGKERLEKIYDLQKYLQERSDDNPALFVSLDAPYERLKISGVETECGSWEGKSIRREYILINFEEQWQQELLIRECQLSRCS